MSANRDIAALSRDLAAELNKPEPRAGYVDSLRAAIKAVKARADDRKAEHVRVTSGPGPGWTPELRASATAALDAVMAERDKRGTT